MLSQRLRNAVKTSGTRQYHLAGAIGVHPGTLSAWLNGIYSVRPGDDRILKLARMLGVPEDRAFVDD